MVVGIVWQGEGGWGKCRRFRAVFSAEWGQLRLRARSRNRHQRCL